MKISVLTLFPEMFDSLKCSILKRAIDAGVLDVQLYNIRDYSIDRHQKCDDYSFGGGEGMVMMPQPVYDALEAADPGHQAWRVYLSPKGRTFNQKIANELSQKEHMVLLCGHYEGLDQRIIDFYIDEEISIGDYVLTGGELAAQVVIDCVARLERGVLGNDQSAKFESFENGLLEYPHYTRPREFMGHSVPEVLFSGDHKAIQKWREEQSKIITKKLRPDLIKE
ncbi:MAG TPA: tRNA (guanosine(37)-N1)-methyltransferase TrmD [Clostridia bacterium]